MNMLDSPAPAPLHGCVLRPAASICVVIGLFLGSRAHADELSEAVRSPVEPGRLGFGSLGFRAGVSAASGPFGVGAQLAVGLGRVDVLAGLSGLGLCLNEDSCDFEAFASGGAQAALWANETTRVGVRLTVDFKIADPS